MPLIGYSIRQRRVSNMIHPGAYHENTETTQSVTREVRGVYSVVALLSIAANVTIRRARLIVPDFGWLLSCR
jgi:hypothetical protein